MLWIGLLLSLASCKDSLDAITLGGDELPTEGITLSIQLPNFTPQEISTRAGGETTESINSLWVLCYDASNKYLVKQDCTNAYTNATADADGYRKINMNLPKGTETVHLIANVPGLTDEQAAKLDTMEDITPDLSKPICWGKAILSDLMNDSKISLTRQCAKITCTVDAAVNNFEITDLHVWHSASKGSIAPANYKESTNENLAETTDLMDDTKHIAGGSAAVVAVNETSAGKADIIIKAKYNGTEGFYKVALYNLDKDANKTTQYALVRNHNYIVKVISVNDAGYATEAEALKAEPENRLKVTVVDDNPEIVDMIACKDYELGVCGTQTVDASSTTAPITLVTNLKAENTTDNNLYKVEISEDAQSWITGWSQGSKSTTTPTSPDESAPEGTKFVLNLTLVANNKSEKAREGTITITSGDLKRTIKIRQEGYDFKRADDRQALIRLKDGETPFAYFDWLDKEMHGVKPSENQRKIRNQGLHFSVGDNTISYLIPKNTNDQFVKKSANISYSDETYNGNNYYKVTLNNSTNNFDLWTDEEGFVIKNTEDADHPITITYPIYHTGVFSEIKNLEDEQLGGTKITGWFYYEVVKVLVNETSEDGKTTTNKKPYYMLDRNLGASNSDFYSPGSAKIANDKGSIGGYFKISNGKSNEDYIKSYSIGKFRVPKGNELEAIADTAKIDPLTTSTGELYYCTRIKTESPSQKDYIYIPISGYYENNSFKDEYHTNLWSKTLLSGYQGFSTSSNEYGFWYLYLDIYNKTKTITNARFVQGYDGSSTGRYKAMPIRLIYVP